MQQHRDFVSITRLERCIVVDFNDIDDELEFRLQGFYRRQHLVTQMAIAAAEQRQPQRRLSHGAARRCAG